MVALFRVSVSLAHHRHRCIASVPHRPVRRHILSTQPDHFAEVQLPAHRLVIILRHVAAGMLRLLVVEPSRRPRLLVELTVCFNLECHHECHLHIRCALHCTL